MWTAAKLAACSLHGSQLAVAHRGSGICWGSQGFYNWGQGLIQRHGYITGTRRLLTAGWTDCGEASRRLLFVLHVLYLYIFVCSACSWGLLSLSDAIRRRVNVVIAVMGGGRLLAVVTCVGTKMLE
jgi:hypothetical protein